MKKKKNTTLKMKNKKYHKSVNEKQKISVYMKNQKNNTVNEKQKVSQCK